MNFSLKDNPDFTHCDLYTLPPITTRKYPSWFNPIMPKKETILYEHLRETFKNELEYEHVVLNSIDSSEELLSLSSLIIVYKTAYRPIQI